MSLKDKSLSTCKIKTMKYLEGQLKMKCANTRQRRVAADFLYAYSLNFVALRNKNLLNINREPRYPLPPLDPTQPMKDETPVVAFHPTKVTFWKYKSVEAYTLSLEDIVTISSRDINKAILRVKLCSVAI